MRIIQADALVMAVKGVNVNVSATTLSHDHHIEYVKNFTPQLPWSGT